MSLTEIVTVVTVVSGLGGAVVMMWRNRADAAKTLVDAASALIDPLRERIKELEVKTDLIQDSLEACEGVVLLARQAHMASYGSEPGWYLEWQRQKKPKP